MQVTVKSFAQIREIMGNEDITVSLNDGADMASLCESLKQQDSKWQEIFSDPVLMACNQSIVTPSHTLNDNDEVAILPPVTGG
ncbi:MoaD/ThiS family protein [Alteromonas halophila]|uniref:Molybdopterin synthase sulfur carrier subunit n=1 Tax=Alteromonas halophila TaxID=516698 RepID=A0A918N0F7_9ALTE|nr:MoaD/ThiS family protein [Alteromonas halophila]GGW89672.1 molybdopterin synthase sulfur carrier subunit [Alteromonas halophila]